jgi:hypothetical protein
MLIRKLGRNMTTNEEELLKKRPLTNSTALLEMTPHANETATPILQEAYKKHATELANIEDRQHKLTLLMLGIFSAGATLMASGHIDLSCKSKWALTILSLAIVGPSFHYNLELHDLRGVTRELLVRCEIALGFHQKDRFLKDEKLYVVGDIGYGNKGRWLRDSYFWTVGIVCIAFIVIVWLTKTTSTVPPLPMPIKPGNG